MGISLALVFHIASAVAAVLLVAWGLRSLQDLTTVQMLLRAIGSGRRMIVVDRPDRYIRRLCRVFGVKVSGQSRLGNIGGSNIGGSNTLESQARIDAVAVASIFVRPGVSLVQFKESGTIEFYVNGGGTDGLSGDSLSAACIEAAFSNRVRVSLIQDGSSNGE